MLSVLAIKSGSCKGSWALSFCLVARIIRRQVQASIDISTKTEVTLCFCGAYQAG